MKRAIKVEVLALIFFGENRDAVKFSCIAHAQLTQSD